ncbi:Leucine-rich repeat [Sesbania bispinosa]|nr:Leucine-rich repeat [Sesbania bispinosa]
MNKCAETDRKALINLKHGFIDQKDILSSWNNGDDCCKWEGVSCDDITGHVTSLDLQSSSFLQKLGGKLDSSICELQHLTSLNLSHNNLKGNIPKCIGSLGHLIELNLADNQLVSVVPYTMANLSNLQTLDLGWNNFVANYDLQWVSHLSKLRYLDLSFMNLSRAIDWPSSISKIPSLSELYLSDCFLPQVDPKSVSHLNSSTSLKILYLTKNNFNSSILSWVVNVSKDLTDLELSFNSLHNIPDDFANMISLQSLDLSHNELKDSIPKSIRSLCQLKVLWLSGNKLSGQLSDHIQQLRCAQDGLKSLDLSDNKFSNGSFPDFSWFLSLEALHLRNANIVGTLPQSFGHLPYLTDLDLSFNQLSGTFPLFKVIAKLTSLEQLDLSNNQLNGSLPHIIGQLSSLWILSLSSNKLNGVISEAHLSNLSELMELHVAQNSLLFNLSSNWVPPFQLEALYASSCILGPKFPTWLKHQQALQVVDISNSNISDSFPEWFWNLSFYDLNVSHNKISGHLPRSLKNMKTMGTWDFSFNNLSGPLPPFPELYALFLSNNMFSGSLSSYCASSPLSLTYLDLSSNSLVGSLSNCWGKFQSLEFLSLAKNNLSGKIPKSFGTLRQITSMHLNNNNFSGEIPSLTFCSNLILIDLGDNNLQGTLPAWVGHHLHQLIVLRLQANKFQGNIPPSLCNLSFLQVLDLSQNNITGEIPQCLNRISALSNMLFPREPILYLPYEGIYNGDEGGLTSDKAILAWKGENREYGKNLGLMTSIDLSYNQLKGEIPQSITTLVALANLNLSGNHLTGFIPNNIGHMEMLESLDLSRNHLCGRMPASFSNLTFLSYMNLSFNNLSGKIPLSTQLQSFDVSTYEGNIGLCGPPLTNHCPGDETSPTGSLDKHVIDEDEDEFITLGFYVSLGLGFFVGFWGVCGTLVIKSSWRHAYFQFFNNMNDLIYVRRALFIARMKRRFQAQD